MKNEYISILMIFMFVNVVNAEPLSIHEDCFEIASNRYKIDINLLKSIAFIESSMKPQAVSTKNRDGTFDIGMMQINTWWLKILNRYGIDSEDLLHPCTNIQVGAWVLAQEIARFDSIWDAVGAYNAGPAANRKELRKDYADKVKEQYFSN